MLKTAPMAELLDAIRRAAGGGMAFGVRPRAVGPGSALAARAGGRRAGGRGAANDEIGAALGIGAKTVETHLARLFERFSIASRTELATRALREGWLDLPPG